MAEATNSLFDKFLSGAKGVAETAGEVITAGAKGATEAAGEAIAAGAGAIGGVESELGRTAVSQLPQLLHPIDYAKHLHQTVSDVRAGKVNLAERKAGQLPPSGAARVVQGLFGPEGPKGQYNAQEDTYKATPIYEATKRDLLGIGEGLVDLAGLFSGVGGAHYKEAAQQESEQIGKATGATKLENKYGIAFRAGARAGQEALGGFLASPLVVAEAFAGGDGKQLYREAPVTTVMNALPLISSALKMFKAGRMSAIQAAEFEKSLKSKGYASADALEQAIKDAEGKIGALEEAKKTRTPTPAELAELAQEKAKWEEFTGQKLSSGVEAVQEAGKFKIPFTEGAEAPVSRLATGAVNLAGKVARKAPYVAAVSSLSPAAGMALGGALALGEMTGLAAKMFPEHPVVKTTQRVASKVKRKLVEPRSYETPVAAEMGEEHLTSAGEVRATETKAGDLPERFGQTQFEVQEVPEAPQPKEVVRPKTEYEKTLAELSNIEERLRQVRELQKQNPDNPAFSDAVNQISIERAGVIQKARGLEGLEPVRASEVPNVENELRNQKKITKDTELNLNAQKRALTKAEAKLQLKPQDVDLQTQVDDLRKSVDDVENEYNDHVAETSKLEQKLVDAKTKEADIRVQEGITRTKARETFATENEAEQRRLEAEELASTITKETQRRQQFPITSQIPIQEGGTLVVGEEGGTVTGTKKTNERRISINPEAPANVAAFEELKQKMQGTQIGQGTDYDLRRLFTSLAATKEIPTLLLLDEDVRKRTIDLIEQQTGKELTDEGRVMLNETLQKIGNEVFDSPEVLTQEGKGQGKTSVPTITGKNYFLRAAGKETPVSLNDVINIAKERTGKDATRTVFNNFLKHYQERLKVAGRPDQYGAGGLTGGLGFTSIFNNAVSEGRRERLVDLFNSLKGKAPELRSVKDKAAALDMLNKELVEPFDNSPEYKAFIKDLRNTVSSFIQGKEGLSTYPSVVGLPTERTYDITPELPSDLLSGLKRVATTYNPAVILGNYLGNAFVESLSTGDNPIRTMTRQATEGAILAKTIADAQKTGDISLQHELVLRAVPRISMQQLAETGAGLSSVEKVAGKANPLAWLRGIYAFGDYGPKLTEANKQSANLLYRLRSAPDKSVFYLNTGPNIMAAVQKAGETFTVINPETGKILTSGTLENAKVKRVLGAAVKEMVDRKYPDVSQLPDWYAKLASGGTSWSSKLASAVTFTPFMSYVLKAADTPWRRGILSTLVEGTEDSPIAYELKAGEKVKVGAKEYGKNVFRKLLDGNITNYMKSRGLVNSFAARYDNLSQEEQDQLRQLYANAPSDLKPLIFGNLVKLSTDEKVRNTTSPSFANFWSMTDTYLRSVAAVMELLPYANQKDKAVRELLDASESPQLDKFSIGLFEGKQPAITDTMKGAGIAGGLALPLFVKAVEASKLGKAEPTFHDYMAPLGILGRVIELVADEQPINTGRPVQVEGMGKILDVLIGTQFSSPTIPARKVEYFVNGTYQEIWKSLINPLIEKAEKASASGNDDLADKYYEYAEELNEMAKDRLTERADTYVNTLNKLGMEADVKPNKFGFRKVREVEVPTIVPEEKPQQAPEEPVKETSPYGGKNWKEEQ